MSIKTILFVAFFCLLMQSCLIFYPKTQEANKNCELLSRELKLEEGVVGPTSVLAGCLECIPAVLSVAVATSIVSGSIILVGDTVHWLERQGRCEDGYLKQKIDEFKRLFIKQSEQPQPSSGDEGDIPTFTP